MAEKAVRIEGLRELEAAFRLYGRGMEKGIREALEAGAEVVRPDAATFTAGIVKRSEVDWTQMRVGVTRRVGYVAPVQRGKFSKRNPRRYGRSKFKARVLEFALEPALTQNTERVAQEFEDALADLARLWSRV